MIKRGLMAIADNLDGSGLSGLLENPGAHRFQLVNAALNRGGERLSPNSYSIVREGVAIIPIAGALVSTFDWSYTSYEEIARDVELAVGSDAVRSIVLEVASPGGMVSQCDECADAIRAASKVKPVSAHVSSIAASAAYLLAAAASTISASPTSIIGSVGAKIQYLDFTPAFERFGAKMVKIVADQSPNKSHDSGSDEQRAELQPIINEAAEIFIRSVAKHRRITRAEVLEKYGQGAVFSAREALSRGMIDAVAALDVSMAGARSASMIRSVAAHPATLFAENAESARESDNLPKGETDSLRSVVDGALVEKTTETENEASEGNPDIAASGNDSKIADAITNKTGEREATAMSKDTIKALIERRQALLNSRNAMTDEAAKRADKQLNDRERLEIKQIDNQIKALDADIEIHQTGQALNNVTDEPLARKTEADASEPIVGATAESFTGSGPRDKKWRPTECAGYTPNLTGLGEMAIDLIELKTTGRRSSRLVNLTALGHEGEKGGFFLPTAVAKPLKEALVGQMSLLEFCDTDTDIDSYTFEVPVEDDQDWDTTRGPQAAPVAEGATTGYTDISLDKRALQLGKVQVKVKVTDELMKTVSTLSRWLNRKASRRMAWKISNMIARGTGVNQPLGFLNSGALVTVAAEGSQAADTINAENITKMIAANSSSEEAFENLLFLMHPELVPQADLLTVKATSEVFGAQAQSPRARPGRSLFGVPYRTHQICNRAGDLGDIMLLDLKQYYAPIFRGGIEMKVSDDAGFDDDTTRIKFTIHLGGIPYLNAPIASRDGSFQQSPFVVLAAR